MTIWIYSGARPSNGAKELATSKGFLRLRNGRFHKVKPKDTIINWGCTYIPLIFADNKLLNHHWKIANATNKKTALTMMSQYGVKCIEWTFLQGIAQVWSDQDHVVVIRNKLTGHSGDGIVIIDKNTLNVPLAPLYTKYVFKVKEFRVHVVFGNVIDTQQKIKDPDRDVVSWKVRSYDNGFIFARNNIADSIERNKLAVAAVESLGLDFGAVDIIQDKEGNYLVLEVNTAPGLEGQTVTSYVEAFRAACS